MDDKTVQRKINQIVRLINELDAEAKRRYGPEGQMFAEAAGDLHMMAGDGNLATGSMADRLKYIRFSSVKRVNLGVGAW